MTTYRQDRVTGEFYEVVKTRSNREHYITGFDAFVSPVDGSVINNATQLREHERRTGQTNDLDHLREQAQKEVNRKIVSPGTVEERKQAIRDPVERVRSSGFSRRILYDE